MLCTIFSPVTLTSDLVIRITSCPVHTSILFEVNASWDSGISCMILGHCRLDL